MIRRHCVNKVRCRLQLVTYGHVILEDAWARPSQALECRHVRCLLLGCNVAMSCDLAIPLQKLLQGFVRVLEWLLEIESLEPALAVNLLVESQRLLLVPPIRKRSLTLVFEDQLIESGWLGLRRALSAELECRQGHRSLLVLHSSVHIPHSRVNAAREFFLVVDS